MKLFSGFRQQLIHEKNLKKYLLYAIGEILLVMIGILLAFQVDNWNEDRVKKIAEIGYYKNIKDQISEDRNVLQGQIAFNDHYKRQFEHARQIVASKDRTRQDTLGKIAVNLTNYSDFDREANIYETMVNSGQIHLLRNQNIVNRLRILEERYNYINRMESIHYDAMITYAAPYISSTIDFSSQKVMSPERIYNFEFQNFLILLLDIMQEKEQTYNAAIMQIDEILALIKKELQDN